MIKTVERYSAFLYPYDARQKGRINLYCGEYKLYLLFVDSSDPLPPNSYNEGAKIGTAYEKFSQYQYYLDLVRNEKPIRVTFRIEVSPPTFVVYCSYEPPGDGEM